MAPDPTILQAALLEQFTLGAQTTAIIITAEFTLVFGYFAALHLFLRDMPLFVRLSAFAFFAAAHAFLAFGHIAVRGVTNRAFEWREHAVAKGDLPSYWRAEYIEMYREITAATYVTLLFLIIGSTLFLFVMTFFHRWKPREAP